MIGGMTGAMTTLPPGEIGLGFDPWAAVWLALVVLAVGMATMIGLRMARTPYGLELAFCAVMNAGWARVMYRLRREGPCTVPGDGPVIVVANHTCAADPLMVIAGCYRRRVPSYLVAREFTNLPLLRYFTTLSRCIPVRRDGSDVEATKAALRHLRAGGALGVFIEGRIPKPGETRRPKDGPAMLALRSGAMVVPVHIRGTKYSESVWRSFFQWHRARVRFGPPVDLREWVGRRDRPSVRQATQRIHEAIRALAPPDNV